MAALKGIIFDMDGVLCDSEHLIRGAVQRMLLERYRIRIPDADFLPFVGTGEDSFIAGPARRHGVQVQLPEDKREAYRVYLEMIRGVLRPLPGVHAFVAAARAAGLRLAVASAADAEKVAGNLAEIGLPAERFDAVVRGEDVTRKKPAPDCFLLAAGRLGLAPSDCLVVEDAENGVRAAVAAGSPCLGLATTFPAAALQAAGATWTASDLAGVPDDVHARLGTQRAS